MWLNGTSNTLVAMKIYCCSFPQMVLSVCMRSLKSLLNLSVGFCVSTPGHGDAVRLSQAVGEL